MNILQKHGLKLDNQGICRQRLKREEKKQKKHLEEK